MKKATAKRALEVQAILGPKYEVLEFEKSTATSEEAAEAIGCDVAQIAKSLVFRMGNDDALLVVASGRNRVNEKLLAGIVGERVCKAEADFVREKTGYAIGGVAPVGHRTPVRILLDVDLFDVPEIWAAAGTPKAVFRMTADQLEELTGGAFVTIAER